MILPLLAPHGDDCVFPKTQVCWWGKSWSVIGWLIINTDSLPVLTLNKYGAILLTFNRWEARWIIIQSLKLYSCFPKKRVCYSHGKLNRALWPKSTKWGIALKHTHDSNFAFPILRKHACLVKEQIRRTVYWKKRGRRESHRGKNPAIVGRKSSLDVTPHLSQD